MKTRKTLIAVAVAALIPLGAAVAGDNDQYGKDSDKSMSGSSFKKLDTNKDGKISQAEAAADSTIVFSSADTNGDGYLDKDELKAASKAGSGSKQQSMPQPDQSSPSTSDPTMPRSTEPSSTPQPDTETPPR